MPIAMLQLLLFWSGDGWLLSLSPLNASRVWFSYPFPFLPCKLAYLDQIVSSIFDSRFSCLFFIQVLKCFLYPVRFLLFACIKAFAVHSLKVFNPLVDCSCHCYISFLPVSPIAQRFDYLLKFTFENRSICF